MKPDGVTKSMQTHALWVVAIAVFADMLIYGMVVPILPHYAESLGASQGQIGLLFASYAVSLLIGAPLFGLLSDRVGRKGPMLWGLIGLCGATLLFMVADSFWLLVTARLLQGMAAAITWTAGLALLADLYPPESRGRVMGLALSGQAAGTLLGPAIGGWLLQLGGHYVPFLFAAGIALLDAILRLVLLRHVPDRRSGPERGALRGLFRSRTFRLLFAIILLGAAVPAALEPTLPLYLERTFGISSGMIGLLFMVPTGAYGLVAPFIGTLSAKWGNQAVIRVGLALTALSLPLIALPHNLIGVIAMLAFLGVGIGVLMTPTLPELAHCAEQTGAPSYGVVYAAYNTAYSTGLMVGPLASGWLAEWLSLPFAYGAIGVALLLMVPVSRLFGLPRRATAPHSM